MIGKEKYPNSAYIHHQNGAVRDNIREIVFGVQDGMVSTLGAVTGVAVGSGDPFVVLLSGIAIIAVESISMGIGAYTSSRSEKKLMERMLDEECQEIIENHAHEKQEMFELFVRDGWEENIAREMTEHAAKSRKLMLREMAYRELHISPDDVEHPATDGVFMFFAYIAGGIIPLISYFFLPVQKAMMISIPITLIGLFILGTVIAQYTKEKWYQTGLHMFLFGGTALVVGYFVGAFADNFLL